MTIKEFAKLCNCNPQTLRYYDKEDLLKPKMVDSWTGYRHYSEEQAIDFVKIKNLQEADFSIKEIKELLTKSDEEIYLAFDKKIETQVEKLERIRKTQATYLSEKQSMEAKIREIREKVMAAAKEYDPQEEFGITQEYYEKLMGKVNELFENVIKNAKNAEINFHDVEVSEGAVEEEEEYLNPLGDNKYLLIYEKHYWDRMKEVLPHIPSLENGEYFLQFEMPKSKTENIAFANVMIGYMFDKYGDEHLNVACNINESKDGQNHFWLLKAK